MRPITALLAALAAWNAVVFLVYGADKRRAVQNRRRISERALLLTAALLGAAGALAGMILFNHKTRRVKFFVAVPLLLALHLLLFAAAAWLWLT